MKTLKAPALRPGDTVALISTSAAMAKNVPHRRQRAIKGLESLGFKVVLTPNALKRSGYTAGNGKERAEDLNWALARKEVRGIISFIGGNHSIHMLPHIDFSLLKRNPKVICGYSDTTVLELACYARAGLVGFYGPAGLTQFAEYPAPDPYTVRYFQKAVSSGEPVGRIEPAPYWTDEVLNWYTKSDLTRPRKKKRNSGHRWLRPGSGRGPLVGGCISSLMLLLGTPFFPCFDKAVFFWEIPEGSSLAAGEPLSTIDAYLHTLRLAGVFRKLAGMIVGRPFGYSRQESKDLERLILTTLEGTRFPILFGADFGHTDPIITIPIGVQTFLDSGRGIWEITESGVI